MFRTWLVRLEAMKLTLSVRSFHVPEIPRTWAWPPSLPSVPTSRATRVTSEAKPLSWSTIVLIVSVSSHVCPPATCQILFASSPLATAVVTAAMFRPCAALYLLHRAPFVLFLRLRRHPPPPPFPYTTLFRSVVGEVLPRPRDPPDLGLAAELAVGADLARHPRHLRGEAVELVDHRVDRVRQLARLPSRHMPDPLREFSVGHRRRHRRDVPPLRRPLSPPPGPLCSLPTAPPPSAASPLSLHDALPICCR